MERYNSGGLAHYAHEFCSALALEGHEIALFCFGCFEVPPQQRAYTIIESPDKRAISRIGKGILNFVFAFRVIKSIFKTRPKAVFLDGFQPMFSLPIALFCRKYIPVFCIQHEVEPRIGDKRISFFQKNFYNIVSAMIVHRNTHSKHLLEEKYGVTKPIFTIDLGLYTTDLFGKETAGDTHEKTKILSFGTVRPDKGLDLLVKAYPGRNQCDDLRLQIAGQARGEYAEYFAKVVAEKEDVSWNRNFIPTSEIGAIYSEASFVVLPFLECTQSASLRMAMYFEKPVIASSVGEIPVFIDKYHVGIQVPRGDVDALCQAMIFLATNPDLRNEYINNIKLLNKSSELSWRTIIRDLFDEIKEREIW